MFALLQFLAVVKELRRSHPRLLVALLLNNYRKRATDEQEDNFSVQGLRGKRAQGFQGPHSWIWRMFLADRTLSMMKQRVEELQSIG